MDASVTCTVRVGTELLNRMSQMSRDPSAFVLKHTAGLRSREKRNGRQNSWSQQNTRKLMMKRMQLCTADECKRELRNTLNNSCKKEKKKKKNEYTRIKSAEIEKMNEQKHAYQRAHLVGLQVPDVRLHPWNFVHMIDDSLMSSHHVRMDQSPTVRKYLFKRLFVCLFVCLFVRLFVSL
jgi:hypothetical protein